MASVMPIYRNRPLGYATVGGSEMQDQTRAL